MIEPRAFAPPATPALATADAYLSDPAALKLVEFFIAKGLPALKDEDRREQWYDDWIAYQAKHRLYATMISPARFSSLGNKFDLLRYARFLEVFAYFSPAHGYSLQCTFLGLFAILMGSNDALKREAVASLEAGGLCAFGVSEQRHGSDLFGNEFTVIPNESDAFTANGTKYYIGNANVASLISVLSRKGDAAGTPRSKRAPFVLFALRPGLATANLNVRKIRTLGIRAAFVADIEVKDYVFPATDIIASGRQAWDAFFGAVTLGKFFLSLGSIGICEHALAESVAHLSGRNLFGKPVIEMPHIRRKMSQAYARLAGMKLYAYRALDYVHAASATDRRYLLFCAVQKAKVSTEGVMAMASLSECINAKGFESETYFETALRDIQLIPGLEGSTHLNLALAAQFMDRYFSKPNPALRPPESLIAQTATRQENEYLMEARGNAINTIEFPHFLDAYKPLKHLRNVRLFARQTSAFRLFIRSIASRLKRSEDAQATQAIGQCIAIVAYGQLIAENAKCLNTPAPLVSAIFHLLVNDFTVAALTLASLPTLRAIDKLLIRRLIVVPTTTSADWDVVAQRMTQSPTQ